MKKKTLKIYIDGGSRGNPGSSACAAVIYDEKNNLISEEGRFLGKATNNFAEYSALHLALQTAKKLGAETLYIYSDSELLVKQYNGEYKIKDPKLASMMDIIAEELKAFKEVRLSHISRNLNKIADKLVNNLLDSKSKLTYSENKRLADESRNRFKQDMLF